MEAKEKFYFELFNSNKGKNHIDFQVELESNEVPDLHYMVMALEALKKENKDFDFDLKIHSKTKDEDKESRKKRGKTRANVSSFLTFYKSTLFKNKSIFYVGEGGFERDKLQEKVSYGRVIPLIPVNSDTYGVLASRVGPLFEPYCLDNPKRFNKEYVDLEGKKDTEIRYVLQNICMDNLFYKGRSTSEDAKKLMDDRADRFASSVFFEKVKDISILAFFIFCAQERFHVDALFEKIKAKPHKGGKMFSEDAIKNVGLSPLSEDANELDDTLIIAQDISDGLLQLIENIVFHAGSGKTDGTGLLSIRIFEDSETRKNYLEPKYKRYFAGEDDRLKACNESNGELLFENSVDGRETYEQSSLRDVDHAELKTYGDYRGKVDAKRKVRDEVPFYLEVKLTDQSGKNICNEFVSKHKNKKYFSFDQNMCLRTFFNPNDDERSCWDKFNLEPVNVIHHHGLQLFDALIQSLDGCFIAQSLSQDIGCVDLKDYYSTSGDGIPQVGAKYECFSGTQYTILFPFYKRERKGYSFVNTSISYTLPPIFEGYLLCGSSGDGTELSNFFQMLYEFSIKPYDTQEEKERRIGELCKKLNGFIPNKKTIFVCDSKELTINNIELFSKAIMQFISANQEKEINIAITNCNEEKFKQLTRSLAVFYDHTGKNEFMKHTQIYISGEKSKDEFLLVGADLKNSLAAQIKLYAARGIAHETSGGIFAFLLDMLERRPSSGIETKIPEYVPFDLLIKDSDNLSVFEHNVMNVLNSDVQNREPGCKIVPNHMRIGSKIHSDSFYEAHMLFSNNYYTGRFAWLIREIIINKLGMQTTKRRSTAGQSKIISADYDVKTTLNRYLFVGYETYSEMLLRDVCKSFDDFGGADYCVFEYGTRDMRGEKTKDRFRNVEKLRKAEENVIIEYIPIFIVPINSTLSTFNKLEAEFRRQKKDLYLSENSHYVGIIQTLPLADNGSVDTTLLNKFFEWPIQKSDMDLKRIKSKLINPHNESSELPCVHYAFLVDIAWNDPLSCKFCFPSEYVDETPLIETDKTSVVPSQLYGIQEHKENDSIISEKIEDVDTIKDLYGCVKYGHTKRDSKHFQYYVETDKYFDNVQGKIGVWLKEVKKSIEKSSQNNGMPKLRYDIIVYPEHYSNTGFVKIVNEAVFNGASLTIGVDFEKEFRDNFKSKHSDLSSIYSNLEGWRSDAEINFHYVDDTIIHGSRFLRVKGLVHSLFPKEAFSSDVKINIFRTVIVLLNRNSSDSAMNYVSNLEDFYSYANLRISSLRTHGDACILCQEMIDNELLGKRSVFNELSEGFYKKYLEGVPKDIYEEISSAPTHRGVGSEEPEKYLLLYCTHKINARFSTLKGCLNEKACVLLAIVEEIMLETETNKEYEDIDILVAYIKVLSSPFISFRKSNREAIFDLIISLFEILLKEKDTYEDVTKKLCCKMIVKNDMCSSAQLKEVLLLFFEKVNKIVKDNEKYKKLIMALMAQSVALKSNYIIRHDNIIQFFARSIEREFDERDSSNFNNYYLSLIKRLVASSSDEAKAMFLEHLILTGNEYGATPDANFIKIANVEEIFKDRSLSGENESPGNKLNIEIEKLLKNAYIENTQIIYDAARDLAKNSEIDVNNDYYLENYRKMLLLNGAEGNVEGKKRSNIEEISDKLRDVMLLFKSESKIEDGQILNHLSKIANAFSDLLLSSLKCQNKHADQPQICFIGEHDEEYLFIDDDNTVKTKREVVLDPFACSKGLDRVLEKRLVEQAQEIINNKDDFILKTYKEKNNTFVVNMGGVFRENRDGRINAEKIRMVVQFDESCSEYEKIKALRYVFAFNNQINNLLKDAFGRLLSEELSNMSLKKQMEKVKAGDHTSEERSRDLYDPKHCMESVLELPEVRDKYPYPDSNVAYGFYINSIIGRINIKLLTKSEDNWEEHNAKADAENYVEKYFCKRLATLVRLPASGLITLVLNGGNAEIMLNSEGAEKTFCDSLLDTFKGRKLLRNNNGNPPRFAYFMSIVAELVNSIRKYGKTEGERYYAYISVDDDGYLCIANDVKSNFNISDIENGLKRRGEGISLAVTCGFFESFYRERGNQRPYVKIEFDNDKKRICIKLPLLEKKYEL